MALSANSAASAAGSPTGAHGFHPLRVTRVVPETAEASSFVLQPPEGRESLFAYEAGQFCTFRVRVGDEVLYRCYSMSSAPGVDDELAVTVKRVPGGAVSNLMIDTLRPGDTVEASPPAGVFCLAPGDRDVVAFAAGSGVTPVFSLIKAALATTGRRARLYYANRDREAVIFAAELDALVERYGGRLEVVYHLDVERGFVGPDDLGPFLEGAADADHFVCGPAPFMDIVETALLAHGVDAGRIHIERFTPAVPLSPEPGEAGEAGAADGADGAQAVDEPGATATQVTVELGGRTDTVDYHPGTTILQTARQMGMSPPSSCESGSCATCMAKLVDGTVTMYVNDVLTDDEVAEGWVLTCQSVPTAPSVHVVYEGS
jgi:ferredoxin-NADP reductase